MDNYFKGKNVEEELERNKIPLSDLPDDFLWMQVKGGSKMSILLSHACGILEQKAVTAVVWTGEGVAIPKAISCAEILKRQFSIPHQVTKLTFKRLKEVGHPVKEITIKAAMQDIRCVFILCSGSNTWWLDKVRVEEFWEPKTDGLETIVVKRQIPVIHILLSLDSNVNTQQYGYQALQGRKFWQKNENNSQNQQKYMYKSKKAYHKKPQEKPQST